MLNMPLALPDHPLRPLRALGWAAAWLWVVLALAGCSPKYTDFGAFIPETQPLVTATEYRVMPPDVIFITSKRVREIDRHTETVRPDGKITLALLGSHYVAGKTVEEISAELQTIAREYYQDADVSVRVAGFNSKKVFVWGEVASPGPYPYTGANTVMSTLALAQPTRLADNGRIDVLRPGRDGKMVKRMTIDLDKMVKEGDMALNAVLEEGDVLYVPPNPLATVGLALQQVLLPIQPAVSTAQGASELTLRATGAPMSVGREELLVR